MSCSDTVDLSYEKRLKSSIQYTFSSYVKPDNVLNYFHKYDYNVLTQRDLERVKAVTSLKGDSSGADELLDRLTLYQGWFECTLKVLQDPKVKLGHVAKKFKKIKERLDNKREEEEKKWKEKHRELEEQLRQKESTSDQRILELEAERGKVENTDHADITKEEKDRKLTGNVRELEKVAGAIKAELEQKDQLISDLTTKSTRQHNEIQSLQQEKNALLDSMQKQVLIKGGSAMQIVFCPSHSESVTLFNFYMTSWIHKDTPDFASKHGIARCDVPAALRNVADFMTNNWRNFSWNRNQQYDLKSGKNQVTTSLQAIQDAVNSWRDNDWSEDVIKCNLLGCVAGFFNICYSILTLLERHQTTELASYILYTRDIIIDMLDSLVDELGGWAHISSLLKENNSFWAWAEKQAEIVVVKQAEIVVVKQAEIVVVHWAADGLRIGLRLGLSTIGRSIKAQLYPHRHPFSGLPAVTKHG